AGATILGFQDLIATFPAVPADALIKAIRGRAFIINVSDVTAFDGSYAKGEFRTPRYGFVSGSFLGSAFFGQNQGTSIGDGVDVAGPWLTAKYGGAAWSIADIDALQMALSLETPN